MTEPTHAGPVATPAGTASRAAAPLRLAVIGGSEHRICGVRDYSALLEHELRARGVSTSLHWLEREQASARATRSEFARWRRRLAGELSTEAPDAIVLHYSVFMFSYRGVPIYLRGVRRRLQRAGVPVISVLHEFAFPLHYRGWRAKILAITQRIALIGLIRDSAALVVTTEARGEWLDSRAWLAKRPTAFAPVHSALPQAQPRAKDETGRQVLGLFGFTGRESVVALVLDALSALRERGLAVELSLIGARPSEARSTWLAAARERGVADAVEFSGVLELQGLSNALARCDVLAFADVGGPSSRNSSLAASLASGVPVVAIDGPRRWQEPVDADALALAEPTAAGLADAVATLLEDQRERELLGDRGRRFAHASMNAATAARTIIELCEQALARSRAQR